MAKLRGFVKMFFKHFLRDFIATLIIAVVVVIATLLIGMFLYVGIRIIMPSILGLVILNTIFGLIGSGIGMNIAYKIGSEDDEYFVYTKEDDKDASEYLDPSNQKYYKGAKKASPRVTQLHFLKFIIFLMFAGSGAIFIWLKWDWFTGIIFQDIDAALKDNTIMVTILLAVESVIISQFFYFGFCVADYSGQVCPKCKHAFFLEKVELSSTHSQKQGYKDKTKRENVGSIGEVQIYADVTSRKYYTDHHTTTRYHYKCHYCGDEGVCTRHKHYQTD